MTTQSSPHAAPETTTQHSILQQAQAAAAGQTNTPQADRHEAVLQEIDLVTLDAAEDSIPPPPYGDIYGEIRNEKDGLNTVARVTDDGRVNIQINQLNRRLSQIFTPAYDKRVQAVQDSQPPPPLYVPPSLGGEDGSPSPPSLNVVIQVVGSRGDVQPFVALGRVLKNTYGHRVRLATHPTFQNFVQENGLEFFSIGGDPSQLMAFMVKNPGLMPGFRSVVKGDVGQRRRDVAEYIQGCWRSCHKTGDGLTDDDLSQRPFVADCIIANPPSFAHIHCAEKLGIPLHIMFTMPYSPTQAFPHPLANIQSSNTDPQLTNYISYAMIEVLTWQGLGDLINRFRAKCLGLEPVCLMSAPGMLQRLKIPHTYCWSSALIPKPKDWGPHISISGFYFLRASDYTPSPELQAFLNAGPPPVYIGFGSIVLDDPNAMTELIFEAVRKTGQRVLLSKGWGGMGADELLSRIPDGVFMLGNVPHDWLFERVSCVVHHGGAGTTAAGITAGRPTLVVPFFGDQPFWGAMVARAGAGPEPIPHKQLTADKLADAIGICLRPESLERAKELASKIATERGSDTGAQSFHQYLEVDRLRCTLAPSRNAAWRIKRTQVRLSAFAACTLANADLLDFHDLKLYRPQEYYTDEGPSDPVSGGFIACCRAFSGMAMGVAEFPLETVKAVYSASGPSRRQSQASTATDTGKSKTSSLDNKSTPPLPRGQSQTSLKVQSQDHDMLRQTGPYTNKGFGRIATSAVQAPMDISVNMTKGFHNMPKLWGDDTVRPQERVSDFKSGIKAMGKEFGYGMYDGVTGLVTQPWNGARKDGTSGFFKGIGKGIGGFATKPSAALFGILSHPMKGVHKEIQKLFGSSVENYIITSRTAQGHEEWLQSSDAEKEDVIARWKLIQKYLKKKYDANEMVRDALEAQRVKKSEDRQAGPEVLLEAATTHEIIQLPVHGTSRGDAEEDVDWQRARHEDVSWLQRQQQDAATDRTDDELLRHATTSSEAEAQRHAREELEYEEHLKRAMAQSLEEQPQTSNSWHRDIDMHLDNEDDEEFKQARGMIGKTPESATAMAGVQQPPAYDYGHLAGTSQSDFEAQHPAQRREKTTQEKTEEEIVLEYIKKQSLVEVHHQNKGKGRAAATEDEDLEEALKLSLQEHKVD